jgi:hypothetical protein
MRRFFVYLSMLACIQLFSGCAWFKRLVEGTETLEDKKVTALRLAAADGSTEVCAGAPIQLQVTADIEGQEQPMTTWAYGPGEKTEKKGHLAFEGFQFSSNFGSVKAEDGTLVVPNTGLELLGKAAEVQVTSEHAPGLTGQCSLGIHFGCGVVLNFSGAPGEAGPQGPSGQSGADGRSESSSGSYARPGGHGQSGTDGGHGGRGGPGGNGHSIIVDVAKIQAGEGELVLVQVTDQTAGNSTRTALVDPARGGKVTVLANGGPGGPGGSGGIGGRGGHGGTGAPAGDSGDGGNGGNGGDGGDGGNGGTIMLRYDRNHDDLVNYVEVQNSAGPAGYAGGAGPGGSAPPAFSGARSGRSGQAGQPGHQGRPGSDGSPATPQPTPRSNMFPDASGLNFI